MTAAGRPREFDRETALAAAMRLFWRKGFAAASMNDLCDAMGIRSPSLYAAFGSKEALYREAVQHYLRTIGNPLWEKLNEGETAREGVWRVLCSAASDCLCSSKSAPGGCMAMLGAVGDEWPDVIVEDMRTVRAETLALLERHLERAVKAGELPPRIDTERLSRFYLGVFQGMAVQGRDGATAAELKGMAEAAMLAWPMTESPRKARTRPGAARSRRRQ